MWCLIVSISDFCTLTYLHLSISNGIVPAKIHDKRDVFDFEIDNLPFLDGDVPRSTSYGVYMAQRIRFGRVPSFVTDNNTGNIC